MAPRVVAEKMVAMAVETSDTTTTEAEGPPQAAARASQGRARMLKLAGAAGAVALAVGALAAVATGRADQFSSLLQQAVGGATELQQIDYKIGRGCKNWEAMKLQEASVCSVDECFQLCASKQGCKAMNFQGLSNELCSTGGGKSEGTCYLYGGECDCQEVENTCWTLGYMPPSEDTTNVVVNSTLTNLDYPSLMTDKDAYAVVFNTVKQELADLGETTPEFVHVELFPGSVKVFAMYLNKMVQEAKIVAGLAQTAAAILSVLEGSPEVTIHKTDVNQPISFEGASVQQVVLPPDAPIQPQPLEPMPTAAPTAAPPPGGTPTVAPTAPPAPPTSQDPGPGVTSQGPGPGVTSQGPGPAVTTSTEDPSFDETTGP